MYPNQSSQNFKALRVHKENDDVIVNIESRSLDSLPKGDLLIKVEYSSLNYKDALSASCAHGVTKKYPHTPGIDASGIVEKSDTDNFPLGTKVIITGFDLGMNTSGGFAEYIRVPKSWVVKCPGNMTTKESMILGTAGLTAGLSVKAISEKVQLRGSRIVVSGATGGLGSLSIKLLSHLGAEITAITGKIHKKEYLINLGASKVLNREEFIASTRLPLTKKEFHGAIDTVGGEILSSIVARLEYGGTVAVCGNVSGPHFKTTVFPFILRSNRLIGIDSAECSIDQKKLIWQNYNSIWKLNSLDEFAREVELAKLVPEFQKILKGDQVGRILVKI